MGSGRAAGILSLAVGRPRDAQLRSTAARIEEPTDRKSDRRGSETDDDHLEADPLHWVLGSGVGSAVVASASGMRTNSHLLLLHILLETGIVVVAVFAYWALTTLRFLAAVEPQGRPIFWLTVVLLLFSTTAETFYPVPAHQGFLGLYIAILAIASSSRQPRGALAAQTQGVDWQPTGQSLPPKHAMGLGRSTGRVRSGDY